MAADNLPSEFDVIILGTGLSESVIAAACSRVGQRVLHVDRRDYYAGNWASFTFNGLLSWIEQHRTQKEQGGGDPSEAGGGEQKENGGGPQTSSWEEKLDEGEEVLILDSTDSSVTNLEVYCYASQEPEEEQEEEQRPTPPGAQGGAEMGGALESKEEEKGEEEEKEEEMVDQEANGVKEKEDEEEKREDEEEEREEEEKEEEKREEEEKMEPSLTECQAEPHPSSAESQPEPRKKISYAKILKEGRRFNIDLVSKLMYSRGSLVDLLIKSNVSRYAEFKNVSRILTYRHNHVEQVPCSRSDVFASKQLTVVEKRMLMKFLTFSLDYEQHPEEYQEYAERPYWDFLQTRKLTENLQHFLFHSIAMVTEDTPTSEGLKATQHFLRCLGRYGNTPFLFPLYGLGEIPQCFCRMCAVFGGIYCLRHSIQCLVVDKETGKCKAVIDSHGRRISGSHFVVEDGFIGAEHRKHLPTKQISRAVLITDRSVLPSDSEQQVSLVSIPPVECGGPSVRMVELCSSSMTCMPGTYLVHLTCSSSGSAHQDLSPVVSRMFQNTTGDGEEQPSEDQRPSVLWVMYFNMRDTSGLAESSYDLPNNIHVCSGPDSSLGSQHSISLAESVFQKILPEEEFCPPAPNPEDILYDGDTPSEGFTQGGGETGEEGEGEGEEGKAEGEGEVQTEGSVTEHPHPSPSTEE